MNSNQIKNPETGRYVLKNGKIGKSILAKKSAKKSPKNSKFLKLYKLQEIGEEDMTDNQYDLYEELSSEFENIFIKSISPNLDVSLKHWDISLVVEEIFLKKETPETVAKNFLTILNLKNPTLEKQIYNNVLKGLKKFLK